MEDDKQSIVSTSASAADEESKTERQSRSEPVEELSSLPNEDKSSSLEETCQLVYEVFNVMSEILTEIHAYLIKKLQGDKTESTNWTTVYAVLQKKEEKLVKFYNLLDFQLQQREESSATKENVVTETNTEMEMNGKEKALSEVNVDNNETSKHPEVHTEANKSEYDMNLIKETKHASEPGPQIPSSKGKLEENIININELWKQQKNLKEVMQVVEMKLKQLTVVNRQMQFGVSELLSLYPPGDEPVSVPNTKKEEEPETAQTPDSD